MVNWQKTDYYRDMKAWERETGLSVADVNRMNNPNGNHSIGGMIAMAAPSIFMTVLSKVANGSLGGASASNSTVSAADTKDPEQIKTEINNILAKYKEQGITSIDDLEAFLQTRFDETDKNIQILEQNIQKNNAIVDEKTKRNTAIDTELGEIATKLDDIDTKIKEFGGRLDSLSDEDRKQLDKLIQNKTSLEANKKKLEAEKNENIKAIGEANAIINKEEPLLKEFEGIQKDIDKLKSLSETIGKNSIEGLVNANTANVTELIKQYNKAQAEGASNVAEIKAQLKTALQGYVDNPANNNKTILNYAEKYFSITRNS